MPDQKKKKPARVKSTLGSKKMYKDGQLVDKGVYGRDVSNFKQEGMIHPSERQDRKNIRNNMKKKRTRN